MSLVDELTDEPVDRALPAPSGLPAPAGQQPILPPPHLPSGPRLPPRESRPPSPPTGQVGITMPALLMAQPAAADPAPVAPQPRRLRKRLIALAIVVVVVTISAFAIRGSRFGDRFTGHGYDTNPLPLHGVTRPSFTGADYTVTYQNVSVIDGLPTNVWFTEHELVNYTSSTAKATMNRAQATIIGGTIGKPQSSAPPLEMVLDANFLYKPGQTPADPWIRRAHNPATTVDVLNRDQVRMYQDVFDPTLRAQRPTAVTNEILHDVAVTTYTYTFAFGDFYEAAPRLFDQVRLFDGNAADDATVTVTVSFDDQWLVRYLDVELDHDAVLDHRAKLDPGTQYPYRFTMDLAAITDTPAAIVIPVNAVDAAVAEAATTTTTTTTTTPRSHHDRAQAQARPRRAEVPGRSVRTDDRDRGGVDNFRHRVRATSPGQPRGHPLRTHRPDTALRIRQCLIADHDRRDVQQLRHGRRPDDYT